MQLGPGDGKLGFGALQIRTRARFLPKHLLLAAPGKLVLFELCLLDLELGAAAGQLRFGGLEVVLGDQGIDLRQQLSLFDLLTRFHREIGDLTRDLGPHIHLLDCLQYATGEHRLLHILAGYRCGQYRVRCVAWPGQPGDERDQYKGEQGELAGFSKSFHLSPERNERRRARAISCSKWPSKRSEQCVRNRVVLALTQWRRSSWGRMTAGRQKQEDPLRERVLWRQPTALSKAA